MRFIIYFFLSIIFFCNDSKSQKTYIDKKIDKYTLRLLSTSNDSLKIESLCELALTYKNKNPQKGLELANNALKLSKENHWEKWYAQVLFTKAQIFSSMGKYPESIENYKLSNTFFSKLKEENGMVETTLGLSEIYNFQGQFTKSLELIYKSLSLAEKNKNYNLIAKAYQKIGITLQNIGESKNSIKNLLKAYKILENNKDTFKLGDLNIDLGFALYNSGNKELALNNYLKGENYCKISKNYQSLVKVYSYLGMYYNDQGNLNKAIEYLEKAIKLEEQDPYPYGIAFTYIHCANSLLNNFKSTKTQNNLARAKLYLDKSLAINKALNNNLGLYLNYFALSEYYSLKNDHKSSLEYYKKGVHYNDIIYNSATKETTKNIEYQRNIELKEKELKINQLELKDKEKEKWLYLAGILFLIAIGGLLYYQNLQKKKTNRILVNLNQELDEANKIKLRFFSIINHDLRGPISSFINFFNLQKYNRDSLSPDDKIRMEDKLRVDLENLLESMDDILIWSKGQMEFLQLEPKNILISDVFNKIEKLFSTQKSVNIRFENPLELSLITDENYLNTIMRNLTSNAIKATAKVDNPTIVWNAFVNRSQTILTLTDNGKGAHYDAFKALYDQSEVSGTKTGLGLHLIRDLAQAINCKIEVTSQIEKGTTFTLVFLDS